MDLFSPTPQATTATVDLDSESGSPARIHALARELRQHIDASVSDAGTINVKVRLLAMNARIEASHAGQAGRGFAVVAEEMATMAAETHQVFARLENESQARLSELVSISQELGTVVRGTRLADLALTNIDLVDRCLYERTCDVRWWATDQAVVNAVQQGSAETGTICCSRLGVILKAYTVYFDILLCDLSGNILANGRPENATLLGENCRDEDWFSAALATADGDAFGFQSSHRSAFVNDRSTLAYSCKVCRDGNAKSEAIGVLAVFFNWEDFAKRIIAATPITGPEREKTRIVLVEPDGTLVADSEESIPGTRLRLPELNALMGQKKAHLTTTAEGKEQLVGFARSPGFETYATGWGSLILQDLDV